MPEQKQSSQSGDTPKMVFYGYKLSCCMLHDSVFPHLFVRRRQIKKSVRAHLFRKMAIYIEFDQWLV